MWIAMWSGPRNISTALMRSWENREDTAVSDEPFYGAYLKETGLDHPGRDEIVEAMESDGEKVVKYITGPIPDSKVIWYQKHMAHHMLADWSLDITVDIHHERFIHPRFFGLDASCYAVEFAEAVNLWILRIGRTPEN